MKFRVRLIHSEEGYSVSVPVLPGCCSQGATEEEAMQNIAEAIREYLEVRDELDRKAASPEVEIREIEVIV